MDRENYYLLLDLSVDPAENDLKIIEEAIKKKQTEWSRYRNHPTKAIQAKRYIGLIPEIRKVMTDESLRKEEFRNAKKMLRSDEEVKSSKIDRHIELLMTKGFVTKKESSKLAKMHGVKEDHIHDRIKKKEKIFKIDREIRLLMKKGDISDKKAAALAKRYAIGSAKIRDWIDKKQKEMFSEIDRYLVAREAKGFITEQAITRLSNLYGVSEGDVLMRIKCPIRKGPGRESEMPKPLDKTLEKLINDNLKIIGKSSLYEFLDLSPNAGLSLLEEKSREKETELRRIGQKDAIITASGALAGHCIVLFKSKASKTAYDLTLNSGHLTELNTDMDAAGIEGKIRPEYLDKLLRTAMNIGMDIEEAVEYVREYCRKEKLVIKEKKKLIARDGKKLMFMEKWVVELDPKKKSFWILCGSVVSAILILISGIVISGRVIQANRIKNAYQNVLTTLEGDQDLEQKERTLQDFVDRHGETEYAAAFKAKIKEIHKLRDQQDFEAVLRHAENLYAEKKFEEMQAAYARYLKKHPKGKHVPEIDQKISEIPALIDERDYEKLRAVDKEDYTVRIKAYNEYVTQHPQGMHLEDVNTLVANMIGEYYRVLKTELARCETAREWENCIQFCDDFIDKFDGTAQASEAAGLKVKYQKRIQYRKDMADLKRQADLKGIDYLAAKELYSEYLTASPESPSYIKGIIAKEMADLDRKHRTYLREEKEWEDLFAYCEDNMNSVTDRVGRLEKYVRQNSSGRHVEEATELLDVLMLKKQREDRQMAATRGQREWAEVVAYTKNLQVSLMDRVQRLEKYIRENPSGQYIKSATTLLKRLKQEKAAQDERIRSQQANQIRRQQELKRIQALVGNTGGRFVASGNGTITDRKTGLMWCTLDSLSEIGYCLDHSSSLEYVKRLRTSGYQDWRMPTAEELVGIYKTRPFFPSGTATWFWTSDLIWHGWNKKAYVVTTKQETVWNKEQAELFKCGSVRAVRSR